MTLQEKLREYISACFTGIWIESHEHQDALIEMAQLCRQEQWTLITWDIFKGLSVGDNGPTSASDPLAAMRTLSTLATPHDIKVLVLQNFHRFLNSTEIIQAVYRQVMDGKQDRTILVVLAPVVQLPVESEKLFVVVENELPDRPQLAEIARGNATEESELMTDQEFVRVIDAAAGLTRLEAENAFSLSLVRHSQVRPDCVWELKTQALKKAGRLKKEQSR